MNYYATVFPLFIQRVVVGTYDNTCIVHNIE